MIRGSVVSAVRHALQEPLKRSFAFANKCDLANRNPPYIVVVMRFALSGQEGLPAADMEFEDDDFAAR